MSTEEALLRDLSLLLELTLVADEQDSLETFSEHFIDRLLARTYAYNALFFVRGTLSDRAPNLEDSSPSLYEAANAWTPDGQERYVALPRKRAQYLVGSGWLDPAASGIGAVMHQRGARLLTGGESVLRKVGFAGVEQPERVLQMAVGDVGVLEIYGGASSLLDPHLARVFSTLSDWLAAQSKRFAEGAQGRQRFSQVEASERWMARLLDELPGVIWRADIHGRVTYLSMQAGPRLGLGDASTWAELRRGVHPDDATRVDQAIAAAIAERRSSLDLQYRMQRGPGDVIEVDERILLGFLPDGGLIHRAGFIDLSRRDGEELPAHSTLSGPTFMDQLSHELRAPLFPVIALSDLLLQLDPQAVSRDDWQRHLRMINHSGKALLELVSDLLELSRIEVQRTRLDAGPVDLPHFVRDLRSRFAEPGSPIEFSFETDDEINTVYTDRSALDRVVSALVRAVRSLAQKDGATLTLAASPECLTLRALARQVELPPAAVTAWFEPFPNLARETRDHSLGDGLSMTLVEELSRGLGGDSRARSTPEGFEVVVTLPARKPERLRVPPLLGRVVLLAVRDQLDLLPAALELLALGAEVRIARGVDACEQLLKSSDVDTVVASAALLGRGRIRTAARHPDRKRQIACFLLDELMANAPDGFQGIIRPRGGRAALLGALLGPQA